MAAMNEADRGQHIHAWGDWMDALRAQDQMQGGEPLGNEGAVLSQDGQMLHDGPFAEGKELVGGYLLISAEDLDAAIAISKGCPIFKTGGTVEVRPIHNFARP